MKRRNFIILIISMVVVGSLMIAWQAYNCWSIIDIYNHAPKKEMLDIARHNLEQAQVGQPPHHHPEIPPHDGIKPFFGVNPLAFTIPSVILVVGMLSIFWITLHTIIEQKSINQMKNDFINNMTHEFKTPLASINLAGEMLLDPAYKHSEESDQRILRVITNETKRLSMMVERVLQLSLYDKSRSNLVKSELDMHQMIRVVQEQFGIRTHERQGSLDIDLQATNYQVWGDETHLSNVLFNLLDNALKYTTETPHITIRTDNDTDRKLLIHITDNGIGMNREEQKHVFERFYRASTGNVHTVKGFGLGLSYVKNMVEAHHGEIKLQSTPGIGSTFTIKFPTI